MIQCVAALVFFAAFGLAQGDRGSIRGTVTDPSGANVPDTVVTVRNVNTGLTQTSRTGPDGIYNVPYLPVGTYTVTAEKTGFRKAEAAGVVVNVNSDISLDMRLAVGTVDQTIEVSAAALMLETSGSNLGKVLPTKAINDLPLFITGGLRSNMSFIILTPGVIGSAGNPRIAGGLQNGQSEMLDGAEAQSSRRNDAAMTGVSVEAVEEFKVQSGAYSAEFGRTSNGVINWVTKSGTNELHGSGFVFLRNEFFNARGYTFAASTRPVRRQWNPGVSVGGPVYIPKVYDGRNKAFFFFAYEQSYYKTGRATSLTTIPIPEFRNGDFRKYVDSSGKMIPLYDPFDANGNIITNASNRPRLECGGVLNVICPSRISPIAKAVQSVLPAADDPDQPTDTSKITNNAVSWSRSESKARVPSIKGDYVISDKQRVSFMHGRSWTPAMPCISAIKGVPCNSWPSDQSTKYYRLNHDYIFTPNPLNHVTIGFNKRFVIENPDNINGLNDDWRKAIQIPGTLRGGKPGKGTEYNTEYFRTPVRVDTDSRQRTTSIKEQVAWLQGKHSVKFGFDYMRNFYRRLDCVGCAGSINFNQPATGNPGVSGRTGGGYAAFLLGVADSSNFSFSGDIAYQMPYYAWYVQDDFKVTRKLTMNIGLRYDLSIPKQEVNFQNSNLNFSLANPAAGGLLGAMEFAGTGPGRSGKKRFGETRKNGFGPRLGIAYQLTPKTVIRSGAAIYYQPTREDGNADKGIQGFAGWFYSPEDNLSTGISFLLKDGFNTFSNQIAANKPPMIDPSIQLYGVPFYYSPAAGRSPYFTDWQFSIERRVTSSSVGRVTYHGNVGNKLLSRLQTLNQLDPKYLAIYGTLLGRRLDDPQVVATGVKAPYAGYPMSRQLQQALRPYPQYGNIDGSAGGLNDGHLTFHALETSYEQRFSSGLYALVSYTYCKTITAVDSEFQFAGFGPAQNQYNRGADKAVSMQDSPHNLRMSYVYELPFGKGKKWLGSASSVVNLLVGNWRVSAIHTYVSGTPLSFRSNQLMYGATGVEPVTDGSAVAGTSSTRASFTSSNVVLLNPDWSADPAKAWSVPYLNKAAFRRPNNMEYGNTPRYLSFLRGPWTVNEDFSLLKNFNIDERRYLELRASGSNGLNRHWLPGPNTSIEGSTFGMITQAQGNSPREIQFGLKFYF